MKPIGVTLSIIGIVLLLSSISFALTDTTAILAKLVPAMSIIGLILGILGALVFITDNSLHKS